MSLARAPRWLAGAVHLRGEPLAPELLTAVGRPPPGIGITGLHVAESGPAALGLAGAAPHVAPDGTVVALVGGVTQWREGTPGGRDDPARIATAFRDHRQSRLERAVGRFTAAVWEPREQSLTIVRDAIGGSSLVWRRDGDVVRFATTVEQLLDPDEPLDPDELTVAWHVRQGDARLDEHTYHAAIRRLPAGSRLEIRSGTVVSQRWNHWPDEPPDRRRAPDDAERFREVLTTAVDVDIDPGERPGVLLSGGLDSSAVAAILAGRARDLGLARPRAYSCVYPGHPETDELLYSSAVCERHGIEHVPIACDDCWPLSDLEARLPSFVEPLREQVEPSVDRVLRAAASDGHTFLQWGDGGDHVTGVGAGYVADWLRRGRVRDAVAEIRSQSAVRGESIPHRVVAAALFPLLPRRLREADERRRFGYMLPTWVGPAVAEHALAPELPFSGRDEWWYTLRRTLVGGGYGHVEGILDRRSRWSGAALRTPFFDQRVIEFVLSLPPDAVYRDGRSKALFRDALGADYPPVVLNRLDKTGIDSFVNPAMREQHGQLVRRLSQDAHVVDRGWVEADAWTAAVASYLGGDDRLRAVLWRTLTLEIWLRSDAGRRPGEVLALL